MTQKEFGTEFMRLATAYRGRFVLNISDSAEIKSEIMADWYRYFKDFSVDVFASAVSFHIEKENIPPTLSALLKSCKEIAKTHSLSRNIDHCASKVVILEDDESNIEVWDNDRANHPFEDGWRIDDDGFWIKIGAGK